MLPPDWFFTSPGAVDNVAGLILGVSSLSFSNDFLNLLDSGFDVSNGRITVTDPRTLPEPATPVLLALAGLLLQRADDRDCDALGAAYSMR